MKLDYFLKSVSELSCEALYDLGIQDNFPILGRGDGRKIMRMMLRSKKYIRHSLENDCDCNNLKKRCPPENLQKLEKSYRGRLAYKAGAITVSLRNSVHGTDLGIAEKGYLVHNYQKTSYNFTFILQPYQNKEIPNMFWLRSTAIVLEDIIKSFLVPNSVPFCLPQIFSYQKGQEIQDFSTLVIWPDKDEEEFNEMLRREK